MDSNEDNIFTDIYVHFREFLANFGWPILITLFLIYYFRPQINKLRHEYSLKRANHPMRVEILNEDMKRVRARQQLELLKATENSKSISTTSTSKSSSENITELETKEELQSNIIENNSITKSSDC
mmetsp:Transcript_24867/g.25495  ORF Transcript_24867/g.25495 Transcript_24867/m.25495 type:complete len:126 (-) Transcript_24867:432-809(-)